MWDWIKSEATGVYDWVTGKAGSRKARASSVAILGWGAKAVGVEIPTEAMQWLSGVIVAYVLGQGIADAGAKGGSQGRSSGVSADDIADSIAAAMRGEGD